VARFCHYFPGLYASPAWPTKCGTVPWTLFDRLYAEIDPVLGLDTLTTWRGTSVAVAMAVSDKKQSQALVRDLIRDAFPHG